MSQSKRSYTCAVCGFNIMALIKDEGTIPHVIDECAAARCEGQMWNDFATIAAMAGKPPTHELARNPEAKTDKLELKKVVPNE